MIPFARVVTRCDVRFPRAHKSYRPCLTARVIGMNTILINMLQEIVPMKTVNVKLFGGLASLMPQL